MSLNEPQYETTSSIDEIEEVRLTLGEHLEELRGRILRAAGYIAVGAVLGALLVIPFYRLVENWVVLPLKEIVPGMKIAFPSITEAFFFWVRLAMTIGLTISLPFTVHELWGFIKPGLRPQERKPIEKVVPISIGLFFLGAFLCWFILPPTTQWFASVAAKFPDVDIIQDPADLIYFCAKMMLAFGLGFQLPLVTFALARLGLITPSMIWRYWRHVIVATFLISAVITPSGDPFSMMVMAVPLTGLFFAAIYAAKITGKKDADRDDVLNNLD